MRQHSEFLKLLAVYVYSLRFLADAEDNEHQVVLLLSGPARSLQRTACSIDKYVARPLVDQGFSLRVLAVTADTDPQRHAYHRFKDLDGVLSVHVTTYPMPVDGTSQHPLQCVTRLRQSYDKVILKHWGQPYVNELLGKWYFRWKLSEALLSTVSSNQWTIFLRSDVVFVSPIPQLRALRPDSVYVANFHSFSGYNDRLFLAKSSIMLSVLSLYQDMCFHNESDSWDAAVGGWTSELIYKLHLDSNFVNALPANSVFFRLRMGSTEVLYDELTRYPLLENVQHNAAFFRKAIVEVKLCR